MLYVGLLVASYLLGSIPFGYIIVRELEREDVREVGSGGTGATNVTRAAGKVAGIVTLILDLSKAAFATVLSRLFLSENYEINGWIVACAVAVVVGHIFPVWLQFRGGKGVAPALGVFFVLSPTSVLLSIAVFVLVVWLTRFISLGSIAGAVTLPLWIVFTGYIGEKSLDNQYILYCSIIIGLLVIAKHAGNIHRLIKGTENRFR
jgi:acyl phosphate:glycerol-3-phosphate acyltransferase